MKSMEVISIITTVVAAKLKGVISDLSKEFGNEISQIVNNNILEYQIEEYNRNLYTKTLLHRVQPKALKEFYQPLFITNSNRKHSNSIHNSKNRIPTNSIKELFEKKQFITLIGNAGSGKSTIVKYLFLNAFEIKFKIPIKVELRYLNDYSGSVIEFIKEKIFKLNKIAKEDKIIERLMSSGGFVFFLDGYDEINSSKKEQITKEIDNLVKLFNKNCYLLTSRPYTDIELLPLFHNFEVCDLSDEDINQFIKKQIPPDEKELCDKIIEAVNSKENYSYKSFLSNPLLLSMFILTFQSYSSIPQKRSEFYSQVFDALFSVHDSMSKLAFVREKQCGLSKEQFIEILKLFSFISYFDEKFIFSGLYLQQKLLLIKQSKKNLLFDNEKLITDLQVAIGILNKEGADYAFPHRSLQEYFTAIYVANLNDKNKRVVYTKILSAFTGKKYFRVSAKDNFHLLLSELDELGVIKFGLIPFFKKFIKILEQDQDQSHDKTINNFLTIHSIFQSFNYILKSDEFNNFHDNLNQKFEEYHTGNRELEIGTDEYEIKMEQARKKLAENDIKPFLDKLSPKLLKKSDELNDYLQNENNSDTEIISLI